MSRRDAGSSADRWLERLGVAERAGDKVDELSLGNQQRVQLAAALVHGPELLVLDEPFSGLDPVAVDTLAVVLAEQVAAGVSVIFSSHQLDLVEDLCDSVAIVDHGNVVLAGRVSELKQAGRRMLRVQMACPDNESWADGVKGAVVAGSDARGTRLVLEPGVDALDVLSQLQAAGRVVDFGLELPRLSQLFREAVAA